MERGYCLVTGNIPRPLRFCLFARAVSAALSLVRLRGEGYDLRTKRDRLYSVRGQNRSSMGAGSVHFWIHVACCRNVSSLGLHLRSLGVAVWGIRLSLIFLSFGLLIL